MRESCAFIKCMHSHCLVQCGYKKANQSTGRCAVQSLPMQPPGVTLFSGVFQLGLNDHESVIRVSRTNFRGADDALMSNAAFFCRSSLLLVWCRCLNFSPKSPRCNVGEIASLTTLGRPLPRPSPSDSAALLLRVRATRSTWKHEHRVGLSSGSAVKRCC